MIEMGLAWREGDEEPAVAAFVSHARAAYR
jgi:hypothetical protein